ncbi:MAG: hypothetical protein FWF59_05310 [Turicibacter sp.]|nr:hypothetical protein [Turicibacter sp.]
MGKRETVSVSFTEKNKDVLAWVKAQPESQSTTVIRALRLYIAYVQGQSFPFIQTQAYATQKQTPTPEPAARAPAATPEPKPAPETGATGEYVSSRTGKPISWRGGR